MARYRDIADDLRSRITSGEFSVGQQLPTIIELQNHYDVPGLNTIRQAQQLLVDQGLIEARQGVGASFSASFHGPGRSTCWPNYAAPERR